MTLSEFSERVAHYCDELQIEEENYFYTAVNGVILEISERFPLVESIRHTQEPSDSQTLVNMKLTEDFASFSTPAFTACGVSPYGRPSLDARMGQIIFPPFVDGEYTFYYNKKIPLVTRDTSEVPFEGERLELLILGTAYRLLTIDADYNAAAVVKRLYDEYAMRLDLRRSGTDMHVQNVTGW